MFKKSAVFASFFLLTITFLPPSFAETDSAANANTPKVTPPCALSLKALQEFIYTNANLEIVLRSQGLWTKAQAILQRADQLGFDPQAGEGFADVGEEGQAKYIAAYVWLYLNTNNLLARGRFVEHLLSLYHLDTMNSLRRYLALASSLGRWPTTGDYLPHDPAIGDPWKWIQMAMPAVLNIKDIANEDERLYARYFQERIRRWPVPASDGVQRGMLSAAEASALAISYSRLDTNDLISLRREMDSTRLFSFHFVQEILRRVRRERELSAEVNAEIDVLLVAGDKIANPFVEMAREFATTAMPADDFLSNFRSFRAYSIDTDIDAMIWIFLNPKRLTKLLPFLDSLSRYTKLRAETVAALKELAAREHFSLPPWLLGNAIECEGGCGG